MTDSFAQGAALAAVVRQFVDAATAPLITRIAQLEAERADVAGMVRTAVAEAVAQIEPEEGAPGKDGADCDMDVVERTLTALVAKAVAEIPPPKDGEPGRPGSDVDMDAVERMVTKAVAAIPKPKDGEPGKDGVSLAGALLDNKGQLVLTLSNGDVRELGVVVGKDGEPGERGFGLDDFDVRASDDLRKFELCFTRGDTTEIYPIGVPAVIYRGVWREGEFTRGDAVTFGGSAWHCNKDTTAKPGEGDDWTLMVKRGSPGKDGLPGKAGEPGAPGKPGSPGRDGKNW